MSEGGPRRRVGEASWAGRAALTFGVFAVLGFAIAGLVFAQAPNRWSGCALAAVAAGLGGSSAWLLVCGRAMQPEWWRAGMSGALAGVLLHPYYWLMAFVLTREMPSVADLAHGILFSLLVVGVITVPAGVLAGLSCRALASLQHDPAG